MSDTNKKYIIALDEGTTSCRAVLYDKNGEPLGSKQREFNQIYPHPGWVEHDAEEIFKCQLKVSKATVSRRVSKMEEDGIIKRYDLCVDSSKLGVMRSMVSIQIVGSPVSIVIEQLQNYKEISRIYKSFGDHNIICEVYSRSVDELYDMIQTKLLKMPSVRNVEVDVLVEELRVNPNSDLDIYAVGLRDTE